MKWERYIVLFLVTATLLLYGQTALFDFVNYDDPLNVYENMQVRAGMTWEGLGRAFTTTYGDYWKPLVRLSHMLDWELYGEWAGGHHLTNVLLHAVNAVLLFAVWKRMTKQIWPSAFVAALFALHPLHVSSIAWVTERKDVLCGLFWMLSLWAYARYAEKPNTCAYFLLVFFFCLGLMSKPMVISLPFVFLLLDIWPLRRLSLSTPLPMVIMRRLVWEKAPLFVLSAVFTVVTYSITSQTGQLAGVDTYSMGARIANALVSYVRYLGKAVWPNHLSFYYQHPGEWPAWASWGSALILLAICVLVVWQCRQRPYLLTGWFWFLGTLLPVIGLVQGESAEAMGDRFVYLPLTGFYVMVAWGVPDMLKQWGNPLRVIKIAVCVVLLELGVITWFQIQHWANSESLCRHALEWAPNNAVAHHNLGCALSVQRRFEESVPHFERAIQLRPDKAEPWNNMGFALESLGRTQEALVSYAEAIRLNPRYAAAYFNLGTTLVKLGRADEAIVNYAEAIRFDPSHALAHYNLGLALVATDKCSDAILYFRQAIRLKPDLVEAHNNLGMALALSGKAGEAIDAYSNAIKVSPHHAKAYYNRGVALASLGKLEEAIADYEQAIRYKTDYAEAYNNCGLALASLGKFDQAIFQFDQAIRIKPNYDKAEYNRGLALASQGRMDDAIRSFRELVRLRPSSVFLLNQLAWWLCTAEDPRLRDSAEAVRLARTACEQTRHSQPETLDTLAAAFASAGDFDQAISTAKKAIELSHTAGQKQLAEKIAARLELYQQRQEVHAPHPASIR